MEVRITEEKLRRALRAAFDAGNSLAWSSTHEFSTAAQQEQFIDCQIDRVVHRFLSPPPRPEIQLEPSVFERFERFMADTARPKTPKEDANASRD